MKLRPKHAFLFLLLAVLLVPVGWKLYGWWLKHRLEQYRAELIASGEKLTIDAVLADLRRPQTNFADRVRSAEIQFSTSGQTVDTNPPPLMRLIKPGRAMAGWAQAEWVDTTGRQAVTNDWAQVAEDFAPWIETFAGLHEIIASPQLDFGVDYHAGFRALLMHLSPVKNAGRRLVTAAQVALHQGDTELAAQHLRAALAIGKGWSDERFLISQLVRIAVVAIALNGCWEFIQSPGATEAQLAAIQSDLMALEFVLPVERSIELERVMGSQLIRQIREYGGLYDLYSLGGPLPAAAASTNSVEAVIEHLKRLVSPREARRGFNELLWRSAYSYADERSQLQSIQVALAACGEIQAAGHYEPALTKAWSQWAHFGAAPRENEDEPLMDADSDDDSLAAISVNFRDVGRSFLSALAKAELVEINRQLAVTAIALRRYQLSRGDLPERLTELVPAYLPRVPTDPVDGQPLRYRRQSSREFLLYSVGANAVDDGGDPADPAITKTSRPQFHKGRDWVWPQPATDAEIAAWLAAELAHQTNR